MEDISISTDKQRYFMAILNIASWYVLNTDIEQQTVCSSYTYSFNHTSLLLGMEDEYLSLFIDIASGNPYRIFGCQVSNPKIDRENLSIAAGFSGSRPILLSQILGCIHSQVSEVASLWIYNFNLIVNGQSYYSQLSKNIGINIDYIKLWAKQKNIKSNALPDKQLASEIRELISTELNGLKKSLCEDNRAVEPSTPYYPFFSVRSF